MYINGILGTLVIFYIFNIVCTFKLPLDVVEDLWNSRYSNEAISAAEEHEAALKDLPKNGELFEGDIKMDDDIRNAIVNPNAKRSGIKMKRWPNNVIPYEVEDMDREGRKMLRRAMREFERRTCISFVKRTDHVDYVVYTARENYCASNVGRCGGKQEINLGKDCHVLGTFLHETMHLLGFIHEHSRPDRNEHVKVNWDKIKKSDKSNFNVYSLDIISAYGQDYNFASVMHYRNDAFTTDGQDTLEAKHDPSLKFGQRQKFSVGDVAEINARYGCHKKDYDGLYHNYGEKEIERKKDRIRDMQKRKNLLKD